MYSGRDGGESYGRRRVWWRAGLCGEVAASFHGDWVVHSSLRRGSPSSRISLSYVYCARHLNRHPFHPHAVAGGKHTHDTEALPFLVDSAVRIRAGSPAAAIACDGINSVIRKIFYPQDTVQFAGINTWRGITRHKPILTGRSYMRVGSILMRIERIKIKL